MKIKSVFSTFLTVVSVSLLTACTSGNANKNVSSEERGKPRVIVSTDIGGTDPDDNQSMIHYLMYADRFETEGIISSPYGNGRTRDILQMIDLYAEDWSKLQQHGDFPEPDYLRSVTKQGALNADAPEGWDVPTEGSRWIIEKAKADKEGPLWVLVWGGLEDVVQALHDAPEIAEKIRVYWIGGPNKKWSVHAYLYVARNFPDLWMIEANSTYRGWFDDRDAEEKLKNKAFYPNYMKGYGALGDAFVDYYNGSIKMGDTPSVAYLLHGDPNDPEGESWGGRFTRLRFGAFRSFDRHTTTADTIPTYSVIEWEFKVDPADGKDTGEIWMEIAGQRIDGFYEGDGVYKVRFVPKGIGDWRYVVNCDADVLHGQTGKFVSENPWPGRDDPDNIPLNNWWSDRLDLYLGEYQGARTVSKWRGEYLGDWITRLSWLNP